MDSKSVIIGILIAIGIVLCFIILKDNSNSDYQKIKDENTLYMNQIDSLKKINDEFLNQIDIYKEELRILEENLINSENDRDQLENNLDKFKPSENIGAGVKLLKQNIQNEKNHNSNHNNL